MNNQTSLTLPIISFYLVL